MKETFEEKMLDLIQDGMSYEEAKQELAKRYTQERVNAVKQQLMSEYGIDGKFDCFAQAMKEILGLYDTNPSIVYKNGCDGMETNKYTYDDLRECFEESRLTNPMVGFKYDSFEEYINKNK